MTATMTPPEQTQIPPSGPPQVKKQGLPGIIKVWLKPLFFLSLGLHGFLLFVPLPVREKLEIPADEASAIKITEVPMAKPSPSPSAAQSNQVSVKKAATVARKAVASISSDLEEGDSGPTVSRRVRTPGEVAVKTYAGSFSDFPHYTPSEKGCYGRPDCQTVKDAPIDKIDQYFEKVLAEKDFGIRKVRQETDMRVYKLRGGLEERFLTILVDGKDTLYVLAARPVSDLIALKESGAEFARQVANSTAVASQSPTGSPSQSTANAGQLAKTAAASAPSIQVPAVNIPDEFFTLLDDLIPALPAPDAMQDEYSDAKAAYFDQPSLFFKIPPGTVVTQQASTQPTASTIIESFDLAVGIDKAVYLLGPTPEKFYKDSLAEKLAKLFESVEKVGEFGGGDLYELKQKQDLPLYLNLLPVKNHPTKKEGTIAVLWLLDPRSINPTAGLAKPTPAPSPAQ